MKVSFLVPVYNTQKYLSECVDSLLLQKGANFEIVLIDDGSTDGSGKICDRYAKEHPDLVRVIHKENEGLLLTRRRGFKEAKGEWFICVDSDDYVSPELLSTVVSMIHENNCDMVMYNFDYVDDMGNHLPSRLRIPDQAVFEGETKYEIYKMRLHTVDVNSMWMRAMRRDIVDINVDYSLCGIRNMCEDAVQMLSLYTNAKRIVYIDEKLYHYRKASGSITSTVTWENWRAINRCAQVTELYLDTWGILEDDRKKFYTLQMQSLCNCIRWIMCSDRSNKEKKKLLYELSTDPLVGRCMKFYNEMYCSTFYMRLSCPIVYYLFINKKYTALFLFFRVENLLRGKKSEN